MIVGIIEQLVARSANSMVDGLLIASLAWVLCRLFARESSAARFAIWFSALPAIVLVLLLHGPSSTPQNQLPAIVVPSQWALWVFLAWAFLAGVGLIRLALGLWRLHQVRVSSEPIDLDLLDSTVKAELQRIGTRNATVRISEDIRVPTALGFFRPMVLLPHWVLEELSPRELGAVLLHEFAHLRRWDDWTNLAQKFLRALLFFHPAVWWIDSRLTIEREISCDDFVLSRSHNPRGYAQSLVRVAERSFMRRPVALAQAAVARMKHTAQRVTRILDGKPRYARSSWKPAFGALTTLVFLSAAIVGHTPQLVRLQDAPQNAYAQGSGPQLGSQVVPVVARAATKEHARIIAHTAHSMTVARKTKLVATPVTGKDPVTVARSVSTPASRHQTVPDDNTVPAQDAQVINASANRNASPQFMLVVFQTQEYDEFGNVIVRTYMWRIPASAQGTLYPRST